jgi:hypothetical protein
MADTISYITENGTVVVSHPDSEEYQRRLWGTIQTKRPVKVRNEIKKIRVSSNHELRRLKWGI